MLTLLREKITAVLSHIELRMEEAPSEESFAPRRPSQMIEGREDPAFAAAQAEHDADAIAAGLTPVRHLAVNPDDPGTWDQTPRNAPCPCGSGKKYKHCHGAVA